MMIQRMKYSIKITGFVTAFLLCACLYFEKDDPDSIPAFVQTEGISESSEAIEAYQNVNSPEMEAYYTDVQAIHEQ